MFKAASRLTISTRAFSQKLDRAAISDIYFNDLPGLGLIPPPEYMDLPKVGFFKGWYEFVHDGALDLILNVNSMGYGMGAGIVCFSLLMRAIWTPFIIKSQTNALKMQLLAPEMTAYRTNMQAAYKTGNKANLMAATEEYKQLMRKHDINTAVNLIPLTQIPFLIMFFWTLQDMAYNPEKFPGMETDGFLWFKNLADPDPYFILPVALAVATFTSIHVRYT